MSTLALTSEDTKEGRSHGGLGRSLQRTFQEVESGSNQSTCSTLGEECFEIWNCCGPVSAVSHYSLFLNGSVYCCVPVRCPSLILHVKEDKSS